MGKTLLHIQYDCHPLNVPMHQSDRSNHLTIFPKTMINPPFYFPQPIYFTKYFKMVLYLKGKKIQKLEGQVIINYEDENPAILFCSL